MLTSDITIGGLSFLRGENVVLAKAYKLPLEGKGGYIEFIGRYLKIDDVFAAENGVTAVVMASARQL